MIALGVFRWNFRSFTTKARKRGHLRIGSFEVSGSRPRKMEGKLSLMADLRGGGIAAVATASTLNSFLQTVLLTMAAMWFLPTLESLVASE